LLLITLNESHTQSRGGIGPSQTVCDSLSNLFSFLSTEVLTIADRAHRDCKRQTHIVYTVCINAEEEYAASSSAP